MARITVEDCLLKIPNRFQLVLAATYRARMLSQGHAPKIESKNKPGQSQPSFDKQFLRDYLETLTWKKTPPAPALPPEVIAQRMANARTEVAQARHFDFVIINGLFETALFDLKTVVHSQRLRYATQIRNKTQVFAALNLI